MSKDIQGEKMAIDRAKGGGLSLGIQQMEKSLPST